MEENPYIKMNQMMKDLMTSGQQVTYRFGTCTKDDTDPIQVINVGGIEYKSGRSELFRANGIGLKKGEQYLLLPLGEDQKMIILAVLTEL